MTHPLTPREKVAEQTVGPINYDRLRSIIHSATNAALPFADAPMNIPFSAQERAALQVEIADLIISDLDKAGAPVTALASGSGDHAELAALCRYVQEARDNYERTIRAEEWTRKFTPDLAYALIAENAALRSVVTDQAALHLNMMRGGVPKLAPANIGHLYRGEEAKEVIAEVDRQNPGSNTRATEAEAELREHRITADLLVSTLKADKTEAERKLAEAVADKDAAFERLDAEISQHSDATERLAEAVGLLREWMGTWFVDADSRGENAIADDTRKFLSKEAERG